MLVTYSWRKTLRVETKKNAPDLKWGAIGGVPDGHKKPNFRPEINLFFRLKDRHHSLKPLM